MKNTALYCPQCHKEDESVSALLEHEWQRQLSEDSPCKDLWDSDMVMEAYICSITGQIVKVPRYVVLQ